MLEFSISNQLLSRLDATQVVADSENYLECAFQFSQDWEGTVAVATFGHSKVTNPISVRIVDGKCQVPHEVIQEYGFQLSVYGTGEQESGAMCHIPTNVVTVEVGASGAGQDLTPAAPTKSMYDTLMTAITEGEQSAAESKTSALASAEVAKSAREEAQASAASARTDAATAQDRANECTAGVEAVLALAEQIGAAEKEMQELKALHRGYVLGTEEDRQLLRVEQIQWQQGGLVGARLGLEPGKRYMVRVDDVWYDAVSSQHIETRPAEESGGETPPQASLSALAEESDDGEVIEIPGDLDPDQPVVTLPEEYEVLRDVVRLTAGPVTVEDVRADAESDLGLHNRLTTTDETVRSVEVRTDGHFNGRYFYEMAKAAADRAEAALRAIRGW